ncbi:uncharacterized protein [Nicotiana tomentosiformis]|uniref:uncharacterized protein n=1 Tax=Nicotiana tomentosiformis TaxID=4098 RepID=UPI00388C6B6E
MAAEKIDHTHPLFVHPLDTPSSVLVPVQLTGSENYGIWRRSMRIALRAKRKLGFVTGLSSIAEGYDITTLWSSAAKGGSMHKNKRNFSIYCEFCKMKGHSKENYYQLIGYPTDFKGRRKPVQRVTAGHQHQGENVAHHGGSSAQARENCNAGQTGMMQEAQSQGSTGGVTVTFTPEQYNKILQMLNKENVPEISANMAGPSHWEGLWHRRLGHVPYKILQQIDICKTVNTAADRTCSICPLAKQIRLLFPQSTSRAGKVFELVHGDIRGPYRVSTHDGHRFFLTLVDDCSRMVWIFLLRLKSDVSIVMKDFMKLIKTHFNGSIKVFRSDNAKSPFEAFYGRIPNLQHLRVLGCLCYATNVAAKSDKFASRSIPTVHMGYSSTQKGYKLYNLATKLFFVSKDVSFREDVFPLKSSHYQLRPHVVVDYWDDSYDPFDLGAEVVTGLLEPPSTTDTVHSPSSTPGPLSFDGSTTSNTDDTTRHTLHISLANEIVVPATRTGSFMLDDTTHGAASDLVGPNVSTGPIKSCRTSKPPGWLNDYIHTVSKPTSNIAEGSTYPLSAYTSYASLSNSYCKVLCNMSTIGEPDTY